MAPLYDAVTTRVFPTLKHDRLALKLNGKDDNLRRADFRALATTAGLRASDVDRSIDHVLQSVRGAVDSIAQPKAIALSPDARKIVDQVLDICRARIGALG
jgi:serine/threonine-protein kinase HipA